MAPRLAYAAACEARGDRDRADFIRIQLAYRDHLRAGGDIVFKDTRRELDLKSAHGPEWAGEIASRASSYGFFGGFVEKIALDAKQFLASADELYRLAPIRRLSLTGVGPVLEELFRSPHLAGLVSLCLEYQDLRDRGVEVIARSSQLRELAWLKLGVNQITRAGLEALARSDKLPSLRNVDLLGNPVFKEVEECVGDDQGYIVDVGEGLFDIEKRYGRKTWLHPVLDKAGEIANRVNSYGFFGGFVWLRSAGSRLRASRPFWRSCFARLGSTASCTWASRRKTSAIEMSR